LALQMDDIMTRVEMLNWWLSGHGADPRVQAAAVRVYVAILRYWCRAWDIIKRERGCKWKNLKSVCIFGKH